MTNLLSGRSRGQSLMEYALIFVLIAVVVIAILVYLGPQLSAQYKIISNAL
ncbi:MAG: Flp family type IVb pilin [Ktedonobacterales bacterium]